jgi:hypothetical protein
MKKGVYCLLILLLVSALADDAWAAATPDADDDVLAAQDNDYTLSARQFQPKGRDHDGPLPDGPGALLVRPFRPAPVSAGLPESSAAPDGPSLVYLFRSLRR